MVASLKQSAAEVAIFYQKHSCLRRPNWRGPEDRVVQQNHLQSFVEGYINHTRTTQDDVIVWHFSSIAGAAPRNEYVSTTPRAESRYLIAWRLSALPQRLQIRTEIDGSLEFFLVWQLNTPACSRYFLIGFQLSLFILTFCLISDIN